MPINNNRVIILILKGAHLYIWITNAVQVGEMKTCSSIVHVYQEKLLNLTFSLLTLQQKIIELKTKEFLELAEHVQSEMEKLV